MTLLNTAFKHSLLNSLIKKWCQYCNEFVDKGKYHHQSLFGQLIGGSILSTVWWSVCRPLPQSPPPAHETEVISSEVKATSKQLHDLRQGGNTISATSMFPPLLMPASNAFGGMGCVTMATFMHATAQQNTGVQRLWTDIYGFYDQCWWWNRD